MSDTWARERAEDLAILIEVRLNEAVQRTRKEERALADQAAKTSMAIWDQAVAAERERCATLAESFLGPDYRGVVAAIRDAPSTTADFLSSQTQGGKTDG